MTACRLCGNRTELLFKSTILGKHQVGYYNCETCKSLQTETPYWLDEAYGAGNLSTADPGAVTRNLYCQAVVYAIARVCGLPKDASILDFGGGNGLLCRLLRDAGFDAKLTDAHATNNFAQGFDATDNDSKFDVVCAFEIMEHFAAPSEDLAALFEPEPRVMIASTEIYEDHGPDWWYLSGASGQHVFFYSEEAMEFIAETYNYFYHRFGSYHLFSKRELKRVEKPLLNFLLRGNGLSLVCMYRAYRLTYHFATRDMNDLSSG